MRIAAPIVGILCLVPVGCVSPEATRTRGGGPGADTGNRPADVRMHEGSRQYWQTPVVVPGAHVPLEPARHAQRPSGS